MLQQRVMEYANCLTTVVVLVFSGLSLSCQCEDQSAGRRLVLSCLREYFSKTGQKVPIELEAILDDRPTSSARVLRSSNSNDTNTTDVSSSSSSSWTPAPLSTTVTERPQLRRPTNDANNVRATGSTKFNRQWCRPFREFYSCLNDAVRNCAAATASACRIVNIFRVIYGDGFCPRSHESTTASVDGTDAVWSNALCKDVKAPQASKGHASLAESFAWYFRVLIVLLCLLMTSSRCCNRFDSVCDAMFINRNTFH